MNKYAAIENALTRPQQPAFYNLIYLLTYLLMSPNYIYIFYSFCQIKTINISLSLRFLNIVLEVFVPVIDLFWNDVDWNSLLPPCRYRQVLHAAMLKVLPTTWHGHRQHGFVIFISPDTHRCSTEGFSVHVAAALTLLTERIVFAQHQFVSLTVPLCVEEVARPCSAHHLHQDGPGGRQRQRTLQSLRPCLHGPFGFS